MKFWTKNYKLRTINYSLHTTNNNFRDVQKDQCWEKMFEVTVNMQKTLTNHSHASVMEKIFVIRENPAENLNGKMWNWLVSIFNWRKVWFKNFSKKKIFLKIFFGKKIAKKIFKTFQIQCVCSGAHCKNDKTCVGELCTFVENHVTEQVEQGCTNASVPLIERRAIGSCMAPPITGAMHHTVAKVGLLDRLLIFEHFCSLQLFYRYPGFWDMRVLRREVIIFELVFLKPLYLLNYDSCKKM